MISNLITKIFGSSSDRETKQLVPFVAQINEHFEALSEATQETLISKTEAFKKRISDDTSELQSRLETEGKDHKAIKEAVYNLEQEILDEAKETNADLIIAGSHARHGLERLLGSTAHKILNLSECDVLLVRV